MRKLARERLDRKSDARVPGKITDFFSYADDMIAFDRFIRKTVAPAWARIVGAKGEDIIKVFRANYKYMLALVEDEGFATPKLTEKLKMSIKKRFNE